MKNVKKFFLLSCAIYCTACSGNGNTGNSDGQDIPKVDDSQLAYHNPVRDRVIPRTAEQRRA